MRPRTRKLAGSFVVLSAQLLRVELPRCPCLAGEVEKLFPAKARNAYRRKTTLAARAQEKTLVFAAAGEIAYSYPGRDKNPISTSPAISETTNLKGSAACGGLSIREMVL